MNQIQMNKVSFIVCFLLIISVSFAQNSAYLHFNFDKNLSTGNHEFVGKYDQFVEGIDGQAIALRADTAYQNLVLKDVRLDGKKDFSIQYWIRTTTQKPMVLLAQKNFTNKGIVAQKNAGWAFYTSGGTFAWSIGSGERRINYERENGDKMPINDGEWHQLTLTYNKTTSEFRIYFDSYNVAIYKVNFDFANIEPLVIGTLEAPSENTQIFAPEIEMGLEQLQQLVNAFNQLEGMKLENEEFMDLIVDPKKLYEMKRAKQSASVDSSESDLAKVLEIRGKLTANPYTVFQNKSLTNLKPVSKIYALQNGRVIIHPSIGKEFTAKEKLYPADFTLDELSIWQQALSAEEILENYNAYRRTKPFKLRKKQEKLTVGVWNIWHGGIHWTLEKDGWDSRMRIVEMIKSKKVDIVLMQETYSSGDFIAAELGYYYTTTSDWDYRYQGANISVLSRYPIKEIQVLEATEFNNVAVKLAISKTQEIWAMSNWYGMGQFPDVFEFHQARFEQSNKTPVLFGGDFNAVPHTDGGDSPASKQLMKVGFTDAYRSWYPDAKKYPGVTHRSGRRIDQLYYKGKGLKNTSTAVISTWPKGFPSDHYFIVSKFKLDY